MSDLAPEYFQTRFRTDNSVEVWPTRFAVLSAFATTGESWPRERNELADRALEAELCLRAPWLRRVVGYSPHTSHTEPSWAVDVDLHEARAIGRRYLQDAIYWIDGDVLFVTRCNDDGALEQVARFSSRVDDTVIR